MASSKLGLCIRFSELLTGIFVLDSTALHSLLVLVDVSSLRKLQPTVLTSVRPFLLVNSTDMF